MTRCRCRSSGSCGSVAPRGARLRTAAASSTPPTRFSSPAPPKDAMKKAKSKGVGGAGAGANLVSKKEIKKTSSTSNTTHAKSPRQTASDHSSKAKAKDIEALEAESFGKYDPPSKKTLDTIEIDNAYNDNRDGFSTPTPKLRIKRNSRDDLDNEEECGFLSQSPVSIGIGIGDSIHLSELTIL